MKSFIWTIEFTKTKQTYIYQLLIFYFFRILIVLKDIFIIKINPKYNFLEALILK